MKRNKWMSVSIYLLIGYLCIVGLSYRGAQLLTNNKYYWSIIIFAFILLSIVAPCKLFINRISQLLGQHSLGIYQFHWLILAVITSVVPFKTGKLALYIILLILTLTSSMCISQMVVKITNPWIKKVNGKLEEH